MSNKQAGILTTIRELCGLISTAISTTSKALNTVDNVVSVAHAHSEAYLANEKAQLDAEHAALIEELERKPKAVEQAA